MFRPILLASILSFGLVSAAVALPGHVGSLGGTSDVIQVKKDWDKDDWKHNKWKKSGNWHKYNENKYSYRNPPYGWHSYNYRPYGWANRGCIIVGPLWYCP